MADEQTNQAKGLEFEKRVERLFKVRGSAICVDCVLTRAP